MAHPTRCKPLALLLTIISIASILPSCKSAFCTPTSVPPCWPDKNTLAAFAAQMTDGSEVITVTDKSMDKFSAESTSQNELKNNYPGIIVKPYSEADLRRAVMFANKYSIRMVVRCSGADYAGRSTGRGVMLIKTGYMNSVSYNQGARTVTFYAGADHGGIYQALAKYGRVYVGAAAKTVCAAGCLAGGCHGPLSRQFGLGSDNILEIRFMLYNGTMVTATPSVNCDLFQAYLGAGQNAFGIATRFVAKTYPVPSYILSMPVELTLFNPNYPGKPSHNVIYDYFLNLGWLDTIPREISGTVALKGQSVTAQFFYTGSDPVGAYNVLQSLLESEYVIDVGQVSNYSTMAAFSAAVSPAASELWQRKFVANIFLPGDQATLDTLTEDIVSYLPYLTMNFMYGGAVSDGTTGYVPDGLRQAVAEAVVGVQWSDPNDDDYNLKYVQQFVGTMYGASPASYSNDWTTSGQTYNVISDWKTRFYSDYNMLLGVKQTVDPCNVFTAKYGVGSDMPTATCT